VCVMGLGWDVGYAESPWSASRGGPVCGLHECGRDTGPYRTVR
jgi:hypothetical protein